MKFNVGESKGVEIRWGKRDSLDGYSLERGKPWTKEYKIGYYTTKEIPLLGLNLYIDTFNPNVSEAELEDKWMTF